MTVTVTAKGQITLPKYIRERFGIKPGDRVSLRERDDGTISVEVERVNLLDLCGILKPRVRGVTADDMNEAIRKRAAENR